MIETRLPKWFHWQHKLHQVTGLIALRGNRLDLDDYDEMIKTLTEVLIEVQLERKKLT